MSWPKRDYIFHIPGSSFLNRPYSQKRSNGTFVHYQEIRSDRIGLARHSRPLVSPTSLLPCLFLGRPTTLLACFDDREFWFSALRRSFYWNRGSISQSPSGRIYSSWLDLYFTTFGQTRSEQSGQENPLRPTSEMEEPALSYA